MFQEYEKYYSMRLGMKISFKIRMNERWTNIFCSAKNLKMKPPFSQILFLVQYKKAEKMLGMENKILNIFLKNYWTNLGPIFI